MFVLNFFAYLAMECEADVTLLTNSIPFNRKSSCLQCTHVVSSRLASFHCNILSPASAATCALNVGAAQKPNSGIRGTSRPPGRDSTLDG